MYFRAVIIGFMLCGKLSFSQLSVSHIDSLNAKMLKQLPVNLSEFGWARIQLKDGTVLLNCLILEVKTNWIVYKKGGTLHDRSIDKIRVILFEERPLKIEFDELNKGKLILTK